ncbi:hypothetical protein N177_1149 [Lutibaculum baratangense AMV1]|uniref:Leucine-binding protein domain-containing protein n=1 Tax=Lutibaculum baratangense AMV1 TaxID=631454 RepID=V4RKG4_9HYPH|nr:hypothetical protein N177_1149 [Lutibaculum baratangense AMV1]
MSRTPASALATGLMATALHAQEETIHFGDLATLEGPFAEPGKDGLRGMELAFEEFDWNIAGKKIEFTSASSDGNPDVALASARRLVEQDDVDIMVGPLSGSEGIRLAQYAKEHPDTTFLNGGSAAIETTLVDPAENFYRFNTEGAQWTAPLGRYLVEERGWDNIVIVSEDYSFPYAQIFGFMATCCEAGGKVSAKHFIPLGTKDYSSVIAQLPLEPNGVDGMFVVLGGSDAVDFLNQYAQMGGELPIVGVIDAPIDRVWALARDFNGHGDWHPLIAESHVEDGRPSDQVGCVRNFTLADGGHLRERLPPFPTSTIRSRTTSSSRRCRSRTTSRHSAARPSPRATAPSSSGGRSSTCHQTTRRTSSTRSAATRSRAASQHRPSVSPREAAPARQSPRGGTSRPGFPRDLSSWESGVIITAKPASKRFIAGWRPSPGQPFVGGIGRVLKRKRPLSRIALSST